MKYEFERVLEGLASYIDENIYSGMNDLQEFAARVIVGRIINNRAEIKNSMINNGFIRTFAIIDDEGKIDVEALVKDIKREISKKEKITIEIPMFGKMTFTSSDVDVIYRKITGEELASNEGY